jgi:hypothetical protein
MPPVNRSDYDLCPIWARRFCAGSLHFSCIAWVELRGFEPQARWVGRIRTHRCFDLQQGFRWLPTLYTVDDCDLS